MTTYSTMGAPVSEADEARIEAAWRELRSLCDAINSSTPDHVEMLNRAADVRMACWAVTRAIDDAWYYANKAAAPERSKALPKGIDALSLADVSPEELHVAIAHVLGERK